MARGSKKVVSPHIGSTAFISFAKAHAAKNANYF
jgi:hypothetical protein